MATINGTVEWGQVPRWSTGDEMINQQYNFRINYLVSANKPMIYQAIWTFAGIDEQSVPEASGDVVNCIFHVLATTEYPTPSTASWPEIATIRKTRDMPNTNIVNSSIPANQRFTLDISRIIQDQLSYTLVPIGKGSFQNQEFGGMNGGATKQDNITEVISPYNVTRNGSYTAIRVWCEFEQLNSDLELELSDTTLGYSGGSLVDTVRAINSVPNFSSSTYYQQVFNIRSTAPTQVAPKRALSNCPNHDYVYNGTPQMKKSVQFTDQAEWLYFYVQETFPAADPTEYFNKFEVWGRTYHSDGSTTPFVLGSEWEDKNGLVQVTSDISHCFEKETATHFTQNQNQIAVQNVSPGYINDHAYDATAIDAAADQNYPYAPADKITPILAGDDYYKVYIRGVWKDGTWQTPAIVSSTYWYKLDTQDQLSVYDTVKFHWLNTVGGIDSYTATRNVLESLSVNKSLITKTLPPRDYHQDYESGAGGVAVDDKDYYNDSMRGFDLYKGGQEVLNVNAQVNNAVYTHPLNDVEATWLREIFASPNVWIETPEDGSDQDAADLLYRMNTYLRPEKIQYTPVILTNSEIVSLDQEKGLVQFNIEYTLAQGVLTQRN